jgi:hypothetical protein
MSKIQRICKYRQMVAAQRSAARLAKVWNGESSAFPGFGKKAA